MIVSKKKYDALADRVAAYEERNNNQLKVIEAKEDKIEELKEELGEIEKRLNKEFNDERAIAYKTMELEFKSQYMTKEQDIKDEYQAKMNKGIEENFTKLKDSLATLHEEGNANTKYLENMSLKLMDSFGKNSATALGYKDPKDK